MMVLAGDIGGTYARLAVIDVGGAHLHVKRERRYHSASFSGLEPIVRDFIARGGGEKLERACFGVACPVRDENCETPNLPWVVNSRRLASATGIRRTRVINDLHAVAFGLGRLAPEELLPLQEGQALEHGAIAIVGAGTGLGQAFLVWDGARYHALASEGGHVSFAPRNDLEWELRRSIASRSGHVSCERVISGSGLVRIYDFLAARSGAPENPAVRAAVAEEGAPAISRHALGGTDDLCVAALDMFVSAYGAHAGNLALDVLAMAGVYVVGGIALAIAEKLRDGIFMSAFREKGRMEELLARIPVHVVMNPSVGLLGSAVAASEDSDLLDHAGAALPPFNETLGAR